jgi:GNAT superfamily N-acetyltransferase
VSAKASLRLREIVPERYVHEVLPLTAPLWAGRRDFATYAAQTLEIARSRYGRRHYRTVGLFERTVLLASFKRYERTLRLGAERLRGVGIGAVFTPEAYRGRGYASFMLGAELDRSRAEGYDIAYLFSDIRPEFYKALGFRELRSRKIALRADSLPATRLEVSCATDRDWSAIRRCHDLCHRSRTAAFERTALVWEWIRLRVRHNSEHPIGQATNLVVREGRAVVCYVLGVRAPECDAYILDEFGFVGEAARAIPALLRAAAGDLRHIKGWLPPAGMRELLPRGSVRKRSHSLLMMAPLSARGATLVRALSAPSPGDFCWATEHI